MKLLSPSLEHIACSLFSDADLGNDAAIDLSESQQPDSVVTLNWQAVEVSEAIRSSIASHVGARDLPRDGAAQRGDIIFVSRIGHDKLSRDLAAVVGVLLSEPTSAGAWQGFVVAGETDYVGEFDVLIEEADEPVDPAACLIQTWNPVIIWPEANVRRLGRVSASRLNAIVEVSKEYATGKAHGALPTSLARIGLRQLVSGASVVTGTSLGNRADPRRQYQSLYRAMACALTTSTQLCMQTVRGRQASNETGGGRIGSWLWPALTGVAVTVVVGQGFLFMNQTQPVWTEPYRSVGSPSNSAKSPIPALRVAFKPGASYEAIAKALRDVGAQFISGPDDNGEILLAVPGDRAREVATVLRLRDLVDSVEVIEPSSAK